MRHTDALHRFVFEHLPIRGHLVRLDEAWQTILARREYPAAVRTLLGQTLAATALLGATIKFQGRLIVQIQSTGSVHLVVAEIDHIGQLRGLARWREPLNLHHTSLDQLCPDGTLIATIAADEQEPYQGIVALQGQTIASALEQYFHQSEQLPTQLILAHNDYTAAGLLVQVLPGVDFADPDTNDWTRIQHLMATLTDSELLQLPVEQILQRLFHEDTVRLFQPSPLVFACACSAERSTNMLTALGQDEVRDIINSEAHIEISCEYCGQVYRFDAVDAESLFTSTGLLDQDATRH